MSGGAAVSWGSKLQEVALSSTEAEYMAICHAMQEGLYLRMLQMEMEVNPGESGTLLLVDNQSSGQIRVTSSITHSTHPPNDRFDRISNSDKNNQNKN